MKRLVSLPARFVTLAHPSMIRRPPFDRISTSAENLARNSSGVPGILLRFYEESSTRGFRAQNPQNRLYRGPRRPPGSVEKHQRDWSRAAQHPGASTTVYDRHQLSLWWPQRGPLRGDQCSTHEFRTRGSLPCADARPGAVVDVRGIGMCVGRWIARSALAIGWTLVVCVHAPGQSSPGARPTQGWKLVWADEFNGKDGSGIDLSKWS